MATEAQKQAKARYREKVRQYNLSVYPTNADVVDWLDAQKAENGGVGINAYLLNLVKKDMDEGKQ